MYRKSKVEDCMRHPLGGKKKKKRKKNNLKLENLSSRMTYIESYTNELII